MVKGEMDVARNGSSPSRAAGAKYDSVGVTHDAYGKVYQLTRPTLGGSPTCFQHNLQGDDIFARVPGVTKVLAYDCHQNISQFRFELVDILTSFLNWLYAFNCFYKYTLRIVNEHEEPLPVKAQLRVSRRSSEAHHRR